MRLKEEEARNRKAAEAEAMRNREIERAQYGEALAMRESRQERERCQEMEETMRRRGLEQQQRLEDQQIAMKMHLSDLEANAAQGRAKLALQTRDDTLALQEETRRRQEEDQRRQENEDRLKQEDLRKRVETANIEAANRVKEAETACAKMLLRNQEESAKQIETLAAETRAAKERAETIERAAAAQRRDHEDMIEREREKAGYN